MTVSKAKVLTMQNIYIIVWFVIIVSLMSVSLMLQMV